jgi:hypothetical protein
MQGKRVMSLDMGLLLAGAKERGELESRVTNLIEETRSAGWCLPSMSKNQTQSLSCVLQIFNYQRLLWKFQHS